MNYMYTVHVCMVVGVERTRLTWFLLDWRLLLVSIVCAYIYNGINPEVMSTLLP